MTDNESAAAEILEAIRAFRDSAREVIGEADFLVLAERGSPEWYDFTRSSWPEFHWLARLPESLRKLVRHLWEMHELLGKLLSRVVRQTTDEGKRARLTSVLVEILDGLGRAVRPDLRTVEVRPKAAPEKAERAKSKVLSQLVEAAKEARLAVLDELTAKLSVVVEDVATDIPARISSSPAEPVPAAEESVDLAISAEELEVASALAGRLEGPYVGLIGKLPLMKVNWLSAEDRQFPPALTPKHCFDWNPARRTKQQVAALAEVRAVYERLKAKMRSAFGMFLGGARSGGLACAQGEEPEDAWAARLPPGFGRRGGVLARQCDEALMWLGMILPVGSQLPRPWTGFTTSGKLRGFLAEKARFCLSQIREAAGTLQERLGRLQARAEQRALAEERVLAREAALERLASEGGPSKNARRDAGRLALLRPFPTPSGATWEDVTIKFRDRENVRIKVGKAKGDYSYVQMGMVDKRDRTPTKQWALLEDFAEREGTMDWSHPGADRKNQKRSEILARNLQEFFGIRDDPFTMIADKAGWTTRFTIMPR
ncbi:MAG: hypothetical protein ACYTKD_31075 [Planctomycetota bacterium]|jgi:hypothetical protein